MNVNMRSRGRGVQPRRKRKGLNVYQLGSILMLLLLLVYCFSFFVVVSKNGRDDNDTESRMKINNGKVSETDRLKEKLRTESKLSRSEKDAMKITTEDVHELSHEEDKDSPAEQEQKHAAFTDTAKISNNGHHAKSSTIRAQLTDFVFDPKLAQKAVDAFAPRIKTLTAYVEGPLSNEIRNTRSRGNHKDAKDRGIPPQYTNPLPIRKTSPSDLQSFQYPKVDSCIDLPAKLPVDAGLVYNPDGSRMYPNILNNLNELDYIDYAKHCPVDADPFLPWIHDVFPSNSGDTIHIIAQNKRRCNTGHRFHKMLERLEPQVALLQPVGVKTIGSDDDSANDIVDGLWSPDSDDVQYVDGMPRYKLATSSKDADEGGQYTRFICRFHTMKFDESTQQKIDVVIGETLSVYPFNYEFVNYRKRKATMVSVKGKDNGLFWLSNLRFECPVPDNGNLRKSIASGITVLPDGTPSIYVDVVPIRTNPRFGFEDSYFDTDLVDPDYFENKTGRKPSFGNRTKFGFDAKTVFGEKHVLPRVEASGRWANIPICRAPQPPPAKEKVDAEDDENDHQIQVTKIEDGETSKEKPFELIACVWASATFHTRGGDRKVDDTMERTREWIEYNLMMGFDHIYIYDNTHANSNDTDLVETLSPFSKTEVTRIEWPSIVCNNNKPAHENTGERSSQYAAESSCRQRYGQFTEWIAAFDTDEYFVPMGKHNNMKDVVREASKEGTKVLSFMSTRAYPNSKYMEIFSNDGECGTKSEPLCMKKLDNATFLETYNCDFLPLPKPNWADRAKKQIYKPDYVLSHFVHYSTVTKGIVQTTKSSNGRWSYWYSEPKKSERFTNELEEAVMIHTKTTVPGNTKDFQKLCKLHYKLSWNEKCRVGFPIPGNKFVANSSTPEGYEYNCYVNENVAEKYAPQLRLAMTKRTGRF